MEELKKEFVDYETTLELKELGFDEPCFAFFNGKHLSFERFDILGNPLDICNCIEAPTYSQAFRFFREKYGVHSSPRKYDETKWWVEWGTWTSSVFETFEEAELSWIKKLIEIVKNK